VGESCPNPHIEGACMNPALGELYLPKWDEESPGALVQATLAAALFQLINQSNERETAGMLLAGNAANPAKAPVPSAAVR